MTSSITRDSNTRTQHQSWSPQTWHRFPIKQVPTYQDQQLLTDVQQRLASYPPLVFPQEAQKLRRDLQRVEKGEAFILQGGPCAENFSNFSQTAICKTFDALFQMSHIINFQTHQPIVKIGRIAGQMAKPRSSDTQTKGHVTLPSYRGDIINDNEFTEAKRIPDPLRMERGYFYSAGTLNILRALTRNGYQHLCKMSQYFRGPGQTSSFKAQYKELAQDIDASMTYLRSCGIDPLTSPEVNDLDFYTSHEALLLPYEEPLTRFDHATQQWYDLSGHLLWIGDRTRQPNGAHIAFMKGIHNPIGVKVGPTMTQEELAEILQTLNPNNEAGRLVLICRMGSDKIADKLPPLLQTFKQKNIRASWISDPMHGNTISTKDKVKTRPFDKIQSEIEQFFTLCTHHQVRVGGIHLEMTGEDVTECLGGEQDLKEEDLSSCYTTSCDPRLNGHQSREMAFAIARSYQQHHADMKTHS